MSPRDPMETEARPVECIHEDALAPYALRAHHYGRLSGISLAVHAIPDAFLILHAGVGCKYKAAAQISNHDWGRQPHRREGWTEVGDASLIRGAAQRIGPYVRSWYDRQRPGLILVSGASFLEMTGEDLDSAVAEAGASVPCPVRYVSGRGFSGDLFEGYAAVLSEVLPLLPWSEPAEPGHVSVVGYLFDRYEADHRANLHQLRLLLGELGLELDAVIPSGQPMERLARAARSEALLVLPYARGLGLETQLAATGRRIVPTSLPVGVRGTAAWLREVGAALGVDPGRVRRVARRLGGYASGELTLIRDRLPAMRSAVAADTPACAGLCDVLGELGVGPRLVALRDRSLGGPGALTEAMSRSGAPLPGDVEILEDPPLRALIERLQFLQASGEIHVVLGSATELGPTGVGHDREALHAAGRRRAPLARVIVGFPSSGYHAFHPMPTLGFGGAVALAQRLLDGLQGSGGG